jgi:hypothetical protein
MNHRLCQSTHALERDIITSALGFFAFRAVELHDGFVFQRLHIDALIHPHLGQFFCRLF